MHIPKAIRNILDIGIHAKLDPIELKKTRVLNLCVLLGMLHNLVFIPINFHEGHFWNAVLLILNFMGGLIFLLINYYKYIQTARAILNLLSTASLCLSAIKFQNGNEYFLISNLVIINIIFKKPLLISVFSALTIFCFVFIRVTDTSIWMYEAFPEYRVTINMTSALILAFLGLLYYRYEQIFYEKELQGSQLLLEKKNAELGESNTTKEKLFSIIAHDLRSPIAQLRNTLDLVNKQLLTPEEFNKLTEHVSIQVKQLQGGLDNLLKWSNSQLQGIEAKPEKVDFKNMIGLVLSLMEAEVENKGVKVNVRSEGGPIWADPDHLQLVLRNLLSNAIKYSYKNHAIDIHHYTRNHEVIISIADQGDGMDKSLRDHVFSSANIISKRGTMNEKGTGLGLKLCKEFVEKNNGRIWAEENKPKGTIFFVSFPSTI
ncbi:MAG: HAMP domain-containing histidine kinase [Chitinophagaceae bacterium]|nr:HAMP domain-containing histidine kinase [Chitinophagaceae bacterium]